MASPASLRTTFVRWLKLVDEGEPFRLLFPVGWALGMLGIILWPLWLWTPWNTYPGIPHARIMIQGHMSAFIFGFLATALPRLIGAPQFRLSHSVTLAGGVVIASTLHLANAHLAGDIAYLGVFFIWLILLASRWLQRTDVPPPAFVLVASGLLSGFLGTAIMVASAFAPAALPANAVSLAHLLSTQAFLLLPVMGVGAFLLPRFFGKDSRQSFPESRSLPPGWIAPACFAGICGLLVLISFIAEANGDARFAYLLRAAVLVTYLLVEIPAFLKTRSVGTLASAVRVALIALPLGYLVMALLPTAKLALLHIVFITGFSLLTFAVASRVLLGHSGQGHLFHRQSWHIRFLIAGFIFAMLTRVSADFLPDIRLSHYAYAALLWLAAAASWACRFLPASTGHDSK